MSTKVEQQYKLLNAQLMDHVQKQRIEIGLYRKELIALKHENMELREERIMWSARQREEQIDIVRSLMRRFEMDPKCLADSSQTTELESKSSEASFVVNRRSQNRRSSKEICREMRQSSALARSSRTISPTRRRDSLQQEANDEPKITNSTPPREVVQEANDSSSRIIFPTRRRDTLPEESIEAPETTVTEIPCSPRSVSATRRHNISSEQSNKAPIATITPPPRRIAEIALDSSTEEDEEQANTSAAQEEQQTVEEQGQRQSGENLCTIIEDSYGETSPSDCSSPISCDSSMEDHTWSRRALSSLDPNVLGRGGVLTRAKCKSAKSLALDKDNSTEEQPSIQMPRLLVTGSSPTLVESLMRSPALDATKLSPRRSIFSGTFQMSGTNTSTPIQNRSAANKRSEGLAATSRSQPKVRVRKLKQSLQTTGEESAATSRFQTDQTTDFSATCCSISGRRPSRRCRPTQLSEPNLKAKMRNSTEEKLRN